MSPRNSAVRSAASPCPPDPLERTSASIWIDRGGRIAHAGSVVIDGRVRLLGFVGAHDHRETEMARSRSTAKSNPSAPTGVKAGRRYFSVGVTYLTLVSIEAVHLWLLNVNNPMIGTRPSPTYARGKSNRVPTICQDRIEPMSQRVVEDYYHPYLIDDLAQPHTLGRSFYMRPAQRPQIADKEFVSNADFWREVIDERIGAERNVVLRGFNVFDWVPRNPGLYHTPLAAMARMEAQYYVRSIDPREFKDYLQVDGAPPDSAAFRAATSADEAARSVIYTPRGKFSMLQGGIGCVRYKPLQLKTGDTGWLMSATSTSAPDEGIPLLVGNNDYFQLSNGLHDAGAVRCDVFGRMRFVAEEFADLYSVLNGIPRLYVEVSEVRPQTEIQQPGQVSVAASFLSQFEGSPKIYASYVTFDPSRRQAQKNAAEWLKEEYVERLYEGSLLTDFDQRAPMFSSALFTLDQILTSPDLAEHIAKLVKLYPDFDWSKLDRFSYVEHRGDLIVTNSTITGSIINNASIVQSVEQKAVGSKPMH
jgi:hypothetical protein